jgi:uncharacterized protein YqgV (UPF0045/DUF77 family)
VNCRLELFVEPFAEGRPGAPVRQAVAALEAHGLEADVGAFATVVSGPISAVTGAVGDVLARAFAGGATRVSIQVAAEGEATSLHVGGLQDALARMLAQVEEELGSSPAGMTREQKQAAVRILDEQGAFLLRRAIEDVADAMGVSRITIYNYLNAIRREPSGYGRSAG